MKFKLTVLLATFVVALGLLLGTSTAQTEPFVIVEGDTATGIQNLDVDGTPYNVAFLHAAATDIYGEDLIYDFPDIDIARIAKKAVNTALNLDNRATKVGPSSEGGGFDYGIGFPQQDGRFNVQNSSYIGNLWVDTDADFWPTDVDAIDIAGEVPIPRAIRFQGLFSKRAGSVLVGARARLCLLRCAQCIHHLYRLGDRYPGIVLTLHDQHWYFDPFNAA